MALDIFCALFFIYLQLKVKTQRAESHWLSHLASVSFRENLYLGSFPKSLIKSLFLLKEHGETGIMPTEKKKSH